MAGDNGKIHPDALGAARGGALRALGRAAGAVLLAGLAIVLLWRTAAKLAGSEPKDRAAETSFQPPAARPEGGKGGPGNIRVYDPKTGRLVMSVRFAKASLKNDLCNMETVDLERILDGDKGRLLAVAREGAYNRVTNSGSLAGDVVVRRLLPGREEPDLVIRAPALQWDNADGRLTAPDRADVLWTDSKTGRKLTASGSGVTAERWVQTVRFERDVRVSLAEAALPDSLPLGRKEAAGGSAESRKPKPKNPSAPPVTVITCTGPAVFENEVPPLGGRRITFSRAAGAEQVVATRPDPPKGGLFRLTCDRLEVLLAPEHARLGRTSPGLAAVERAAAGPLLASLATDGLERSLVPRAIPPASAPAGKPGEKSHEGEDQVDLVIARGAVKLATPDGSARGESAWYDRPAGLIWVYGSAEEAAEVFQDGNQLIAPAFLFDVLTGEMSTEDAWGHGQAPEHKKPAPGPKPK